MKPTPTPEDAPFYYMSILLDEDGQGPADEIDAVSTAHEVWDANCVTVAVCSSEEAARSVADLMNAGIRSLSVPAAAVVGEPVAWTTETNLIVAKHDLELALTMWGRPTGKEPVALYREPVAAPSAPDGEPECEFGVPEPKFRVGQLVEKASGYKWPGVVVSRFLTQSLQIRYVVECTVPEVAGALHIYSEQQLVALGGKP